MARGGTSRAPSKRAYQALAAATLALTINFWAWSLLSPLGTRYADELTLSSGALSLLLAVPVIVGSLGRLVYGALTDSFGGRNVFAAACLLTIVPVVGLTLVQSYENLLGIAMLLGVGGATFVIGVPFVNGWFPPARRGMALGLYSMGNAGTAVSGFLTPRLSESIGRDRVFVIVAVLLGIMAFVMMRFVGEAPGWRRPSGSAIRRFRAAMDNRLTWDLGAIYAVTFGAYVAFGVYLPVLLRIAYHLDLTDAAARAAGFVLLATAARPIGGYLSDKIGGRLVIRFGLLGVAVLASFVALQPTLRIETTVAYLSLAVMLGFCNGAVFGLLGRLAPANSLGSMTGIIGTVGGLGGFLPPLVLGLTYQHTHSYAPALGMLALCAAAMLVYISLRFRTITYSTALKARI